MAFIAIEASFTSFWNSLFTAPLIQHLRVGSVSLVTYVADCVLFSFQGSHLEILPNAFVLCVPNDTFSSTQIGVMIMTIGENIRRIRKERGLTLKQLGDAVGVSEAYIRAYESGRRNPKQQSLEALATALHVNVEALTGSDFDGVKAMHRLFQVFRQYCG